MDLSAGNKNPLHNESVMCHNDEYYGILCLKVHCAVYIRSKSSTLWFDVSAWQKMILEAELTFPAMMGHTGWSCTCRYGRGRKFLILLERGVELFGANWCFSERGGWGIFFIGS